MPQQVALVTGASSGIGEATARELAAAGWTVYAAARRVDRMQPLTDAGIRVIALDVTDEPSLRVAVERIIAETGRIDLLVNNAGYGSYGSVEEVALLEGRRQLDVNLFGAVELIRLVVPHMRAQGSGRIVNVSSIGGKIFTPFGGWYHASKFALEGISDVLRSELRPFGIDVVVVEPGAIKTEWSGIAADSLLATSGEGPYSVSAKRVAAAFSGPLTARASDPSVIAHAIVRAATARRPHVRYIAGSGARLILTARRLTSDRAFDWLVSRTMS
jgi:NAD(P)-dependent dehydrogenase (short-subunit alcohol dehydrogenase family)